MSVRTTRLREESAGKTKSKGFSSAAFYALLITTIVAAVVLIVILYLYFRQQGSRIDPNQCPEALSGILITPDKQVATTASNCGTVLNCEYTVGTISEAVTICQELGPNKCKAFSLRQVTNSDDFTMLVSDSTNTIDVIGTDTLRIIV